MSGVGSRETGLDSLFASKPVGPGFEPCLGQSAKLAGAPKPLCLSVCPHRGVSEQAIRLHSQQEQKIYMQTLTMLSQLEIHSLPYCRMQPSVILC